MDQQTSSLWDETAATNHYPPLAGEVSADVVVIGAGITGITAALLLAERGRSVVVLEKETVASGETGNTTAHLTVAVDARYHFLRRKYSAEEARLVADASRASLEKIAELVGRAGIDCHFRRVPGYLYTEKRQDVAELKNEAAAAREAGLDARWVDDVPLPFETRGAVLWPDQAQFHPREYVFGLAKYAVEKGVRIHERTFVNAVDDGSPCVVLTEQGRVYAKSVFMATNVPISGFTHVHTKAAAYRTYAMAFHVTGDHPDGLFWDTEDPYHYTRWQETNEGTYLIVGGEDHRVGEEKDTEGCFTALGEYARKRYGLHPLRTRWSGQVIEPHGGLPLIGGSGNLYISTGYSGQGMTFGTLGAMLIADLMTGVDNPWAEVFKPARVHAHMTVREFLTENLPFAKHLASDRLTTQNVEARETDSVQPGEGKILSLDGKRVAAYRSESGRLCLVSAVCTHLSAMWPGTPRSGPGTAPATARDSRPKGRS